MTEVTKNPEPAYSGGNIRDLEEIQRTLKDRLILVGQNLIDFRDQTEDDILELKKEIEALKKSTEKVIDFIETLSGEFNKFAKREDLEILSKQAKMFQPMNFATKQDLKNLASSIDTTVSNEKGSG
ncbi:MAG: hypothetical protein PF542_04975 [Nanoarchaeota archaeon]|jgi:regulator of replication initiation timing|nr:hypothetical protein [Nanoarchaeota archaeon]